jgi:hypothetical protein
MQLPDLDLGRPGQCRRSPLRRPECGGEVGTTTQHLVAGDDLDEPEHLRRPHTAAELGVRAEDQLDYPLLLLDVLVIRLPP